MNGEKHIRGRIVTADHDVDDGVVTVVGAEIRDVLSYSEWATRYPGRAEPPMLGTILPGLVDIHNHGGGGHAFTTTDPAEAVAAARHHHAHGTTTVLAGLITERPDLLVAQAAAVAQAPSQDVAGIYCEGPFLAAARCGAQDPRYLLDPDPGLLQRISDAAAGALRVLTIAPELPGAAALGDALAALGVVPALGHSDADFDTFAAALAPAGPATLVTHLANAMPPLHHRNAGPVAAALIAAAHGQAVVELIADGVHVDGGFVRLVFAAAPGRVALVTDAMAAAGMPDGTYDLGPQPVTVGNGVARLPNGSLAGGTSHLIENVARVVREYSIELRDAVRAATRTPARAANLPRGTGELLPASPANLVIVDETLRPLQTLRHGSWI